MKISVIVSSWYSMQCLGNMEAAKRLDGTYLYKFNNENTRTICEIYSKLTIKTAEQRHRRCSGFFVVNFEQVSHIVLVFTILSLNK